MPAPAWRAIRTLSVIRFDRRNLPRGVRVSASSTFAAMGRHGVLDRAVVAGGIDVRHIFDDVIAQNEINFTLPDLVAAEIYSTPTQSARLSAAASRTQIATTDARAIEAANPGILSASFGIEDLQLLETARQLGLPVVTSNSALVRQVQSNPMRAGFVW
jgi:hypothetical protein